VKFLVYRAEAGLDVAEAHDWYEQQRKGLGADFLLEINAAENAIQSMPFAYRVYRRDTRRFLVHRFPYQLLYRVLDDAIVIVACFHLRRSPRRLQSRE
jgi:plasmid stabilization system protein ParE